MSRESDRCSGVGEEALGAGLGELGGYVISLGVQIFKESAMVCL